MIRLDLGRCNDYISIRRRCLLAHMRIVCLAVLDFKSADFDYLLWGTVTG